MDVDNLTLAIEELRQAQNTLAEACDHYTQLTDFSPAAYVTLTLDGMIEEASLRSARWWVSIGKRCCSSRSRTLWPQRIARDLHDDYCQRGPP